MGANLSHALQRRTPTGRDIGGVIMGCRADLSRDAAAESLGGDSLGLLPQARNRRARQRSVACERELASGGTGRSLKNDSAYRLRIVRMARTAERRVGDEGVSTC